LKGQREVAVFLQVARLSGGTGSHPKEEEKKIISSGEGRQGTAQLLCFSQKGYWIRKKCHILRGICAKQEKPKRGGQRSVIASRLEEYLKNPRMDLGGEKKSGSGPLKVTLGQLKSSRLAAYFSERLRGFGVDIKKGSEGRGKGPP